MDPGPNAARHNFRAGKCRPHRRKGRSLLGRALLPQLRHSGPDHQKTDCGIGSSHLRLRKMFSPILHPRQRYRDPQTVLKQWSVAGGQCSVVSKTTAWYDLLSDAKYLTLKVIPTGADDSQRESSAEWRNLLFPSAGKQVSRLRRIVRCAT